MTPTLRSSRLIHARYHRARRAAQPALIEILEPRQLLSVVPGLMSNLHANEHAFLHVHGTPTPITDLTGTAVTINAVTGVAVHTDVATFTSSSTHLNLHGYTATIDWGDGTATSTGHFKVDDQGVLHILGSHSYAATGTFTITVTLTQTLPAVQTPPTLVVMSTANVTLNSLTGLTITATHGTAFTGAVGTFTLPAGDTTTDASTFTARINWGDGSHSLGTVTLNPDGSYTVAGTHTYAAAGSFRITVSVTQANPDNDEDDNGTDPDANGDLHSDNHHGHGDDGHDAHHDDVTAIAKIYSTATVA